MLNKGNFCLLLEVERVLEFCEDEYTRLQELFRPWTNRNANGQILGGSKESNILVAAQERRKKAEVHFGKIFHQAIEIRKSNEEKLASRNEPLKLGIQNYADLNSKKSVISRKAIDVETKKKIKPIVKTNRTQTLRANVQTKFAKDPKNDLRQNKTSAVVPVSSNSMKFSRGELLSSSTLASPLTDSLTTLFSESDLWHRKPSDTVQSVFSNTKKKSRDNFILKTEFGSLLSHFPSLLSANFQMKELKICELLPFIKAIKNYKTFPENERINLLVDEASEYYQIMEDIDNYTSYFKSTSNIHKLGFWLWYPHFNHRILSSCIPYSEPLYYDGKNDLVELIHKLNELQELQLKFHMNDYLQTELLPLLKNSDEETFYELFKTCYALFCTDNLSMPVLIDTVQM